MDQVIVIGGGMSGLAAAHTALENGSRVVLFEKMAFCGGNSSKATSGINGALTRTQRLKGIQDSPELFEQDTMRGGAERPDLVRVLTHESAPGVDWLVDKFGLDLSLVARLGGHSMPRTHRGKTKFPGMTITYALLEKYEDICASHPDRARLLNKSRVVKLLTDSDGHVIGVEYVKDGKSLQEFGPVIVASGGFGCDFSADGLIKKYRPDLHHLPSTNGEFTTGDGIKISEAIGAATVDLEWIQVHPTGLVNPTEPNTKTLFLGAEALRGVGGIILDSNGKRFCNELGRRDYVTGEMWKHKAPHRLILNGKASKEIEWHCKHYKGRGLMKELTGEQLAAEIGVSLPTIQQTFTEYNEVAEKMSKDPEGGPFQAYPTGKSWDKWGKKYYHNLPLETSDKFHVAIITPVIHYTMGGLKIDDNARVIRTGSDKPIGGLYGAGEINGGVHGKNRLGGSSLLDCIVYGRLAGRTATREMLQKNIEVIRKAKSQGFKL